MHLSLCPAPVVFCVSILSLTQASFNGTCFSFSLLLPPYSTELNKVCFGACSGLISSFQEESYFINVVLCEDVCPSDVLRISGSWWRASGWKAFGVQCMCVRETTERGRRLVNRALTSGVTSLITSVTFSQMSFLCD